jgi:hypothetical protein
MVGPGKSLFSEFQILPVILKSLQLWKYLLNSCKEKYILLSRAKIGKFGVTLVK